MSDDDTNARLRALHGDGASVSTIARELGKNERWVYRQISKLGLNLPSARTEPADPLDENLRIRCSTRQLEDLDKRAAAAGVDRSELARRLLWPERA